jgi:hypothetical protein
LKQVALPYQTNVPTAALAKNIEQSTNPALDESQVKAAAHAQMDALAQQNMMAAIAVSQVFEKTNIFTQNRSENSKIVVQNMNFASNFKIDFISNPCIRHLPRHLCRRPHRLRHQI